MKKANNTIEAVWIIIPYRLIDSRLMTPIESKTLGISESDQTDKNAASWNCRLFTVPADKAILKNRNRAIRTPDKIPTSTGTITSIKVSHPSSRNKFRK
jgi:hypothetical protein